MVVIVWEKGGEQDLGLEPNRCLDGCPHTRNLRWTKANLAWGQLPWKVPSGKLLDNWPVS